MGIKASSQITLTDITDAYSVFLTSESYTFIGNTTGAPSGLSCTTQVVAYCGNQLCPAVSIGTITCPEGISATIVNNNTSSPVVTFNTTATITSACEATIPVTVDDVTINKKFSFAVAKTGENGVSVEEIIRYYCFSSNEPSAPTTYPPSEIWTTVEPSYTPGSTNSLYFIDCTVFTDNTYEYSEVSKSSSYEAVNGIQIGGRNLIRNSIDLIFNDYYFVMDTVVVSHDSVGNVLWESPAISVIDDGAGNITITNSSITATDDDTGNITIK